MKIIRWGIIGAGNISTKFAVALSAIEGIEIVAIASRNQEKADQFAEQFHIKKAYSSYEELAKDPEIDVVYIGTPHTEHRANSELCIRNKKAVLCEKPFTLNQQDTEYLIALAKEYDVFLMEAMWTKFMPVTNTVKRWLQEKAVGEVKYFDITFGYDGGYDVNGRLLNPELAGGALLDVGIYPISYAVHMMGKLPEQIAGTAYLGKTKVDEVNAISMRFEDGTIAMLGSAVTVDMHNQAIIVGDKGKIVVPDFWKAESAQLYDNDGELINTFVMPFVANGYEYEAEEVNACLREGKKESDMVPLADTLAIMKLMDSLRKDWGLTYPQENLG
jgi:dihydrodiol dehydrogenase / D-xylose 1-dehydrogenase (NADP)